MSNRSSRSERKLHDDVEDSMPPPVRRSNEPNNRNQMQPEGSTRSTTNRSSRSSNSRIRSRLALEELAEDNEDERPVKPHRVLSTHTLARQLPPSSSQVSSVAQLPPKQHSTSTTEASNATGLLTFKNKASPGSEQSTLLNSVSAEQYTEEGEDFESSTIGEATTYTIDLVMKKRYDAAHVGQDDDTKITPAPLKPISSPKAGLELEVNGAEVLMDDKGSHRSSMNTDANLQSKQRVKFTETQNSDRLSAGMGRISNDQVPRSDSLSTVPDPPSLHQGGHYSVPGAFRMGSDGIHRSTDCDSSIQTVNQFPIILEASLVDVPADENDEECPRPPGPVNCTVSTGEASNVTAVTTTTASPVIEAHPMNESHTIRVFFRNRKVQCAIAVLTSLFAVLTLGTVYGVTGFENIRGKDPDPIPETQSPVQTIAPTTPGDLDLEYFVTFALPEYSREALGRGNSPQAKALTWLRNNSLLETYPLARRLQRYALAVFFFSTGGDRRWLRNDGWLSDAEECTWYSEINDFPSCKNGMYRQLLLTGNELRGTVPPELALLSSLEVLDLQQNLLSGFLPTTLGDLGGLREIRFRKCFNAFFFFLIPETNRFERR